jgi:hypothetical protein
VLFVRLQVERVNVHYKCNEAEIPHQSNGLWAAMGFNGVLSPATRASRSKVNVKDRYWPGDRSTKTEEPVQPASPWDKHIKR